MDDDPEGRQSDTFNGQGCVPPLLKIIPLLTYGSQEVTYDDSEPVSPSFIGVDCGGDLTVLCVNLQMSNLAIYSVPTDSPLRPACFYMGGDGGPDNRLTVTGDAWHHIMICYDLSTGCSATYTDGDPPPSVIFDPGPTFQWVLDDIPATGDQMFPSGSPLGEEDEDTLVHIYPSSISTNAVTLPGVDETSVAEWESISLASVNNPIGIPSSTDYVSSVYNIKMCEVQIFTDVTLDLSVEENRRKFITAGGRPAAPSLAAALLGKSPEVYFKTYSDWQTGNNRGTAGAFSPTGTITPVEGP